MAPDHPITRHVSVAYWKGGDTAVEEHLYDPRRIEKIIAWGGFAGIKHLTQYLQPGLDLITLDPKHSAIFNDMAHWDYLEPGTTSCDGKRGPCTLTPSLATETLMMFFGRYLTPEGAPDLRPRIASNLRPPSVKDFTHALSVEQEFYAGAFLDDSFENIGSNRGCGVQLTWEISANDLGTTNYGAAPNT